MDYMTNAKKGTFLWALIEMASGRPVRRASWPSGAYVDHQEDLNSSADRYALDWESYIPPEEKARWN